MLDAFDFDDFSVKALEAFNDRDLIQYGKTMELFIRHFESSFIYQSYFVSPLLIMIGDQLLELTWPEAWEVSYSFLLNYSSVSKFFAGHFFSNWFPTLVKKLSSDIIPVLKNEYILIITNAFNFFDFYFQDTARDLFYLKMEECFYPFISLFKSVRIPPTNPLVEDLFEHAISLRSPNLLWALYFYFRNNYSDFYFPGSCFIDFLNNVLDSHQAPISLQIASILSLTSNDEILSTLLTQYDFNKAAQLLVSSSEDCIVQSICLFQNIAPLNVSIVNSHDIPTIFSNLLFSDCSSFLKDVLISAFPVLVAFNVIQFNDEISDFFVELLDAQYQSATILQILANQITHDPTLVEYLKDNSMSIIEEFIQSDNSSEAQLSQMIVDAVYASDQQNK